MIATPSTTSTTPVARFRVAGLACSLFFIKFHWVVSLYQGQYRIILSADTASEVRQMPSQKRR